MFTLKPRSTNLIKVRAFSNKNYWAYVHKLDFEYSCRLHVTWPKTSNFIIYEDPNPNLDINHTSKSNCSSWWWCFKSLNTNSNNDNNNTTCQQHCSLPLLHMDYMLLLLHPLPTTVVTLSHPKVSCHLELQHVSTNVLGFRDEEEEFFPPCYFVATRV